jgi:hypothetical protein
VIRVALAAIVIAASAVTAAAQSSIPPAPDHVEFLTRADLRLSGEHLSGELEGFVWEGNFGAEVDLIDYRAGRLTFAANYQVILGEEFRAFDANQGNYILAGAASLRLGAAEVAGQFYHQSRHLSDRPKRGAVDWNMLGVQVRGGRGLGAARLDGRVDVRGVVQKTFVDYEWEVDARTDATLPLWSRGHLIGSVALRVLGVDGSGNRGTQSGYRAEGGIRLDGPRAAVELFVAGERRIDPYPVRLATDTWVTAGFRLLSR